MKRALALALLLAAGACARSEKIPESALNDEERVAAERIAADAAATNAANTAAELQPAPAVTPAAAPVLKAPPATAEPSAQSPVVGAATAPDTGVTSPADAPASP
jgi:hypothetical protein